MRSDRLLSILLLLQAHGRLSARELAARLETSVRTIHRDIDALSQAGVPVFTELGRTGGTALMPGYRTDVTGLTPAEAEAIFMAAGQGALTDLGLEEQLALGLRKLMAALPERQRPDTQRARDRIIVEQGRWLRQPESLPWLELVRQAVIEERRLAIAYRNSSGATGDVTLDPYGLVSKAGTWYLIAAPADTERPPEARLYRVSRIERATMLRDRAVRPTTLDVAAEWQRLRRRIEERGPGIAVRVRVRPDRLELLLRMAASQLTGPPRISGEPAPPDTDAADADPDVDVEWPTADLPFVALGAAEALLLGFGTEVEVIAPTELRIAMARTAAAVAALYAADATIAGNPADAASAKPR